MTDLLDLLPEAAPGGWQSLHRPEAPGAVLDGQPWARSWASFLRAINDPEWLIVCVREGAHTPPGDNSICV